MSKVEFAVSGVSVKSFRILVLVALGLGGCKGTPEQGGEPSGTTEEGEPAEVVQAPEPKVIQNPVPYWEQGQTTGPIDGATAAADGHLLLNIGDNWTPFIFSEQAGADEEPRKNDYRPTYLALARGDFPEDRHGHRAKRDKYLELYGILPTLSLVRARFAKARDLQCMSEEDYEPLRTFDGFMAFARNRRSARAKARYDELKKALEPAATEAGVPVSDLSSAAVSASLKELVDEYQTIAPRVRAVEAAQKRLDCEGFFEGMKKPFTPGVFDWQTHEALSAFEKRHRVFGWGFIGRDTIAVLRMTPLQAEHETVLRVLTERALHDAKVIEDGSMSTTEDGTPRTFTNTNGDTVPVPNFEAELRARVVEAFGLQTPESTYNWLDALGDLSGDRVVAVRDVKRPEYYSDKMDLRISIDRGDVWYEFPYGEDGKARRQPVKRRPKITVSVEHNGQQIPLARFGTTIGGWRSEWINGQKMWKYKLSPPGARVWNKIVAAPVWVPPSTTIPKTILWGRPGRYKLDRHTTGPSYASAYGLVAAYHRRIYRAKDGTMQIGGDQGIRTHGSVDYMSIMRRQSHGCHRMHNHMAVRLMSFVLEHRPHKRLGNFPMDYKATIEHEGEDVLIEFERGGYVYELEEPLPVRVLPGRIRGELKEPVEYALPQYNKEVGAYVMADGQWVSIDRFGVATRREQPFDPDAPIVPGTMPLPGSEPLPDSEPLPGTTPLPGTPPEGNTLPGNADKQKPATVTPVTVAPAAP